MGRCKAETLAVRMWRRVQPMAPLSLFTGGPEDCWVTYGLVCSSHFSLLPVDTAYSNLLRLLFDTYGFTTLSTWLENGAPMFPLDVEVDTYWLRHIFPALVQGLYVNWPDFVR